MTTRAEAQRAKLARRRAADAIDEGVRTGLLDADAPRADDDPTARPESVSTVRTKPFRRSVDLPPARHFGLNEWCNETGRALGFEVTGRAVMNVLVQRLLTDETFARSIRADPELRELSEWRRK